MKRFSCVFKFDDRFSTDMSVLGESFSFNSKSGLNVEIGFPVCGKPIGGVVSLVHSADWKFANDEDIDWGFCDINNSRAVVKYLYFEVCCNDIMEGAAEVQRLGASLYRNLRILYPFTFCGAAESMEAGLMSGTFWDDEKGLLSSGGYLSLSMTKLDAELIDIDGISSAISHIGETTYLPWDLWLAAFEEFGNGEYRSAVVNSAIAIETAMNDRIRDNLRGSSIVDSAIDVILHQSGGHQGKEKLLKKLVNYSSKESIIDKVFHIRNRVVHGGKLPTVEEAKRALLTSRAWLEEQNVTMFSLN